MSVTLTDVVYKRGSLKLSDIASLTIQSVLTVCPLVLLISLQIRHNVWTLHDFLCQYLVTRHFPPHSITGLPTITTIVKFPSLSFPNDFAEFCFRTTPTDLFILVESFFRYRRTCDVCIGLHFSCKCYPPFYMK